MGGNSIIKLWHLWLLVLLVACNNPDGEDGGSADEAFGAGTNPDEIVSGDQADDPADTAATIPGSDTNKPTPTNKTGDDDDDDDDDDDSSTPDSTPPTVTGLTSDATWTASKSWTWGCSESCTYRFEISSSATPSLSGSYSSTSSTLKNDASGTFYLHVQAKDAAGNESVVKTVSAKVDVTAPSFTSPIGIAAADQLVDRAVTATWTAGTDSDSGILRYEIAIGYDNDADGFDADDLENAVSWTTIPGGSSITSYRIENGIDGFNLSLSEGVNYFTSIRAIDSANNPSTTTQSSTAWSTFTPSNVANLDLWLDSSDTDTLFQDTCGGTAAGISDVVGCWDDKSTNDNDVTAAGGARPLVSASGITFDGANDVLTAGSLTYNAASELTFFTVNKWVSQSSASSSCCRPIVSFVTASGALYPWIGSTRSDLAGNPDQIFHGWSGTGQAYYVPAADEQMFFSVIHDGSANKTWDVYRDGTIRLDDFTIPATYTTTRNFSVGGDDFNAARRYAGDIHEIVVYNSILGDTERQTIEGYLACKWDLRDKLPGAHPFYNASGSATTGCP